MNRKIKKNITLNDLAIGIDSLAVMVGDGFNDVQKQLNVIKSDIGEMKSDIGELQSGQEDIKLRLDDTAHHFEVVELQRRVSHLEKKTGIHLN